MCTFFVSRWKGSRFQGFSLVELSAALGILGILSAIAIISLFGFIETANDKEAQSNLIAVAGDARALSVVNMGRFPLFSVAGSNNLLVNGFGEGGGISPWNGLGVFHPIPPASSGPVPSYEGQTAVGFFRLDTSGPRTQEFRNSTFIPVDPTLHHNLQVYSRGGVAGMREQLFTASYDADRNWIESHMVLRVPGSATAHLTQPVRVGDTEIHLSDTSGWSNAGGRVYSQLALWPFVSPAAGPLDAYTYSRHVARGPGFGIDSVNGFDLWAAGGISNNIITLIRPWELINPNTSDGGWPVGTPVANHRNGAGYAFHTWGYPGLRPVWERQSLILNGVGVGPGMFWPGTAYIQVGIFLRWPEPAVVASVDYTGFVFEQVDPYDPLAGFPAWKVPPFSLTSVASSSPTVISAAPVGFSNISMIYASLSDSGVCWVLVDSLVEARTFGRLDGENVGCLANAIDPAHIVAKNFADA